MEQQIEAEELSNSILIEISKTSLPRWQEKLEARYGWHKSENCKSIIFEVEHFFETSNKEKSKMPRNLLTSLTVFSLNQAIKKDRKLIIYII